MKNIVCYFINFNDSYYIPLLHKHYSPFCSKIIMFDNYSTDNSVALAKALGMEVRYFGQRGVLNDQHYLDVKNNCWKEQRGKRVDYVIVVDADEFVQIEDLRGTAPVVTGYNMVSDHLPINHIGEVKTGAYSEGYSKQAIFNPDAIHEINYVHGCHKNNITGHITTEGKCVLYHYRCIGGFERLMARHLMYQPRMSSFNLKHNMGHHYLVTRETKKIEWDSMMQNAKELW